MHLSGQTPLFRAKNLEKYLGVSSIYFKLEGNNPTGHKNDRIAESLVQYAESNNYDSIFVYGTFQYMSSMAYFADLLGLKIFGPKIKETHNQQNRFPNVNWLTFTGVHARNKNEVFQSYAESNHMFYASEYEKKPFIRGLALQKLMEECIERESELTHVWTQVTGGYTLKSAYHEIMRNWINGKITKLPELHFGMSDNEVNRLELESEISEVVKSTNAVSHKIKNEDLKETVKLIKKLENITISTREAFSISALILATKEKIVPLGKHIVILNDGKNDIKIEEVSKDPQLSKVEIVEVTRKLLEPYHDSVEETSDAVQKAIDVGYIFKATQNGELQGVCIVVHMGFTDFIPSYHLAYIGVKKGNKGRGIATELINEAIEKTGGNLSLHVDIPNTRAKKLYEKMGFVHKYNRMLYKGL